MPFYSFAQIELFIIINVIRRNEGQLGWVLYWALCFRKKRKIYGRPGETESIQERKKEMRVFAIGYPPMQPDT